MCIEWIATRPHLNTKVHPKSDWRRNRTEDIAHNFLLGLLFEIISQKPPKFGKQTAPARTYATRNKSHASHAAPRQVHRYREFNDHNDRAPKSENYLRSTSRTTNHSYFQLPSPYISPRKKQNKQPTNQINHPPSKATLRSRPTASSHPRPHLQPHPHTHVLPFRTA